MERELHLTIEGMHCGGCVRRVTAALEGVTGVTVKSVDVGSADATYDDLITSPQTIADAVNKVGFQAKAA